MVRSIKLFTIFGNSRQALYEFDRKKAIGDLIANSFFFINLYVMPHYGTLPQHSLGQ